MISISGKDAGQQECSCIANGNTKWYSHSRKQELLNTAERGLTLWSRDPTPKNFLNWVMWILHPWGAVEFFPQVWPAHSQWLPSKEHSREWGGGRTSTVEKLDKTLPEPGDRVDISRGPVESRCPSYELMKWHLALWSSSPKAITSV